jgi:hypothetical protein
MNVNLSVRCLLKVNLCMLSQIEVRSVPKRKGVAGLDWNMVGIFALLLRYIPRFVLCHVLENGEMSSSDRSASTPYVLFIAGMHGVGYWWV